MSGLFSVWFLDLGRDGQRTFEGRLNHRQMGDVGVTYARYGSTLAASLSHADVYLQGFPVRGRGSIVLDGSEVDSGCDRGCQ
jgi:AraC-binding-like domain